MMGEREAGCGHREGKWLGYFGASPPSLPPLSLAPLLPPDVYFCACSSGCEIGSAPLKADLENGIMGQYTDAKRSLEMVPLHIALDQVTQTHNLWPVRGGGGGSRLD